jgi:hypothetical protein
MEILYSSTHHASTDSGITETVYNWRIAEFHTYYVSCHAWGWSVWVHNAYVPLDEDPNYQQLKQRLGEDERRSNHQPTANFRDELSSLGIDHDAALAAAGKGNYRAFMDAVEGKKSFTFLSNSEKNDLYARAVQVIEAREKYATQAQDHHAIPWENSTYNHQQHPLVEQAGVNLKTYEPNIQAVVGHDYAPYHLEVQRRMNNAFMELQGDLTPGSARAALNNVIQSIWTDIGRGRLRLYAPPKNVTLL